MIKRFNLRAYGLLIENNKVLLSAESYKERALTKFPGGGVEYGEGIQQALIREWQEEVNCSIEVGSLFYVTDYFIQSAFIDEDQIVSFYYRVTSEDKIHDSLSEHRVFWMELKPEKAGLLTFPQDREVFRIVCEAK